MSLRCAVPVCRGALVESVDRIGRIHWTCPACVRRLVGVCRLCPLKVAGKVGIAHYCTACKRERARQRQAKHRHANRDMVRYKDRLAKRRKYERLPYEEFCASRKRGAQKVPMEKRIARGIAGMKARWGERCAGT